MILENHIGIYTKMESTKVSNSIWSRVIPLLASSLSNDLPCLLPRPLVLHLTFANVIIELHNFLILWHTNDKHILNYTVRVCHACRRIREFSSHIFLPLTTLHTLSSIFSATISNMHSLLFYNSNYQVVICTLCKYTLRQGTNCKTPLNAPPGAFCS
jgi:hypothetical protein